MTETFHRHRPIDAETARPGPLGHRRHGPAVLLLTVLPAACATTPGDACGPGEVAPDIRTIPVDLHVPTTTGGEPAPGKRVRRTTPGWENQALHHTLYLPTDWEPGAQFPLIVEYPGNGGYRNAFGDASDGSVEGCRLGYGLSGGQGYIWVCLPFVEVGEAGVRSAPLWWGDVEETVRYCEATLDLIRERWGADPGRVVLAGFSRGAIACNFIGLHDDTIARRWTAFFCHSHYDGVRESWPYGSADRAAAARRLARLGGRPQWVSHEGSVRTAREYLDPRVTAGQVTFETLPFRNHTAEWVLRDIPLRRRARSWLLESCPPNGTIPDR